MKIHTAMAIFLLPFSVFAAGPITSGGGAGVFCPDPRFDGFTGAILDKYESTILEEFVFESSPLPVDLQITSVIEKFNFDRALQIEIRQRLATIRRNLRFLPSGVSINVPSDLGSDYAVPVPTGCELKAIGYYQKNGILLVSTDALNALAPTDQAMFFMHEVLYEIGREFSLHSTSELTRKLTAALFQKAPAYEMLHQRSHDFTWRSVPRRSHELESRWYPMALGFFDFHQNQYTPMILPAKNQEFRLIVNNPDKVVQNVYVICLKERYSYDYFAWKGDPVALAQENSETRLELAFRLALDCRGLEVRISSSGANVKISYELMYGTSPVLRGVPVDASVNYTFGNWMIYRQ